jgi:hypothetical protein
MLGKYNIMSIIATAEPARVRPFYEETLGLAVINEDMYGVTFDANGARIRLSFVQEMKAAPYSVLSWSVPDIYEMIAALTVKEVIFEIYPGFGQDKAGVWTAPNGTKVAWFKDPGGNLLSLTQW